MERKNYSNGNFTIKKSATHIQNPKFGGSEIHIEGYWDEVHGTSWKECTGNPAAIIYALRVGMSSLPYDDNVLYGKINGLGYLVHVNELEEINV